MYLDPINILNSSSGVSSTIKGRKIKYINIL